MGKKSKKINIGKIVKDKRVMIPSITLFGLVIFYFGTFGVLNIAYGEKVFPWVKVSDVEIGGTTREEATTILKEKTDRLLENGFDVKEGENIYNIESEDLGFAYDIDKTVKKAYDRNKMNFNLLDLLNNEIEIEYRIDEEKTRLALKGVLDQINDPAVEARVSIDGGEIVFSDEKDGLGVYLWTARSGLEDAIRRIDSDIPVTKQVLKTRITKDYLESRRDDIEKVLAESLKLTSEGKMFEVSREELAAWLNFEEEDELVAVKGESIPEDGKEIIDISLNKDKVVSYIVSLEGQVNKDPRNAVLAVKDGKVTSFVLSQDGKKLEIEESANEVLANIGISSSVELVVTTTKAEINEDNVSDLGLKELVARGYSNFSGSPKNRVHNIKTGASKFNGVLIKPDEEFSFNKHLGPVDASTGFLPELVILQNKTTPQYGGGLCQVSSTAFRVALNAGLPITARKNHSYPVSYYKPYGVDATIYLPYPDLRFKNDTGSHILIQTYTKGRNLYFDFYGTTPDRTVKFAGNQAAAGASDIVEKVTPALFNHGGKGPGSFDAQFYRFIYNSAGELKTRNKFYSSYDSPDKYPHPEDEGAASPA